MQTPRETAVVQALLRPPRRAREVRSHGSTEPHPDSDEAREARATRRRPVSAVARILLSAKAVRAFGDGFVALLLPVYLTELGFDALAIGLLTTATLLGSAALTLAVGLAAHRLEPRRLLLAASLLMLATGLCFAEFRQFWPLVVVGVVGTLNPTAGDVSLFLPLEHAMLAHAGPDERRTQLFARYSLVG